MSPIIETPSHKIRLHGPWNAMVVGSSIKTDSKQKIPLGMDAWESWLGADFRGEVKFQRYFGTPTGLTPNQKIDLVIETCDCSAIVTLNENRIGSIQAGHRLFRQSVGEHLQSLEPMHARNCLQIVVSALDECDADKNKPQTSAGEIITSVYLELF